MRPLLLWTPRMTREKISTDGDVMTTASTEGASGDHAQPTSKGWGEGYSPSSSGAIERGLRNVASTLTPSWRSLAFLLSILCALTAVLAFAGNAGAVTRTGGTATDPWISSELPDYAPGSTVNLLGRQLAARRGRAHQRQRRCWPDVVPECRRDRERERRHLRLVLIAHDVRGDLCRHRYGRIRRRCYDRLHGRKHLLPHGDRGQCGADEHRVVGELEHLRRRADG